MSSPLFPNIRPAGVKEGAPVCTLAVDAEEDFDWLNPVHGTGYSTSCMRNVRDLQEIVGAYGLMPTYLLTYPVLEDADVVRILQRQREQGACAVGVQLHPWVNPPFDGDSGPGTSFSGNLAPALEERKLVALAAKFAERFGEPPRIYRAGRYGMGQHTAALLEKHGFTVDTSLAPRTTFTVEGGPDYTAYDYRLFWFGAQRKLLEVPLCRSIVGWGGALAPALYRSLSAPSLQRLRVLSGLTRSRCAERITLSPEGNDFIAMARLVRHLRQAGHRVFALSFHSSSLGVGRNPYVQTRADLHAFYDRLSAVLDYLAALSFRFTDLARIPDLLASPDP